MAAAASIRIKGVLWGRTPDAMARLQRGRLKAANLLRMRIIICTHRQRFTYLICRTDAKSRAAYMLLMIDVKASPKLAVWYDGACPLCVREIALMRWLDRRGAIHFVDASDGQTVCPIDRSVLLSRLHASENGVIVSGAAAFAAMWRAIPVLRPLGLVARNGWVLAVLERAYLSFLKARPTIQRFVKARSTL